MNRTNLLIASLVSLSFAACTKSDAKESPPATKSIEAPAPAVAPTPPPAPAPAKAEPAPAPAKTAPKGNEAAALAMLKDIAAKKLSDQQFDINQTIAIVDISAKPQGGSNNKTQYACSFSGEMNIVDFAKLFNATGDQVASAFENDGVSCSEKGAFVECRVRAQMEGESSMRFAFTFSSGLGSIYGFAKYETFMIDDDARLEKEAKKIDAAFAAALKKPCLSAAEEDFNAGIPRKEAPVE